MTPWPIYLIHGVALIVQDNYIKHGFPVKNL